MFKKTLKTNASDIKKALIIAEVEKIYKLVLASVVGEGFINKRVVRLIKKVKYYAEKDNACEDDIVRFLMDGLSELIDIKPPININKSPILQSNGGCKTSGRRVIMFVGPPGSGKTTTLAKLATHTSLLKKTLAIVCLDTYRVAATDQIRIYSDIIGVPYEIAFDERDILLALERYKDLDFVFIDTPRICFKQELELLNIKQYAEILAPFCSEVYLVLSAGVKLNDALKFVEMFSKAAELKGLIFTQTDNTESFDAVFTTAAESGLPVAYFCNGPLVPDNIFIPNPEYIVNRLLDGAAAYANNFHEIAKSLRERKGGRTNG